jgi:hypothetical protein
MNKLCHRLAKKHAALGEKAGVRFAERRTPVQPNFGAETNSRRQTANETPWQVVRELEM